MKSITIECQGYSLAADWYEGANNEVLIVLVGYSSSKANYHDLVGAIVEQTGTSALVLDYSGHGKSPFELPDISAAQNFLEVIAAFDWIKAKYPRKIINVMGTSYGGFLATQLTIYRQFNKLVLRVPAIYRPEEFYTKWKNVDRDYIHAIYRKNDIVIPKHPLLERAKHFNGKVLVVVHEKDEIVPKLVTDTYIRTFGADTYLAKGFGHSFREHLGERDKILAYQKAITDWLQND